VAYQDVVLADSPTVYYRLGDTAAPAVPTNGLGVNCAATGVPAFGVAGAVVGDTNTAVSFPGSAGTDYLQTASSPGTAYDLGDGPFSIEFWYKTNDTAADHNTLSKGTGSYIMRHLAGGTWAFRLSGTGNCFVTTAAFTDTTKWHHVVVTRVLATQPTLYVDGVAQAGTHTARTFGNITTGFGIGVDVAAKPTGAWNGYIDEVALYQTVLSAAQVLTHYQAGITSTWQRIDGRGFHPGAGPTRISNFRRLPSANGVVTSSFFGDATTTVTTALAATGVAATSSGAATTVTAGLTATGAAGVSTGAVTATITATLAATGSVTSGGAAATTITATLTATGNVATTGGAATTVTATLTASGNVATSTGAASTVTATLTATGTVGKSSGAATTITATLTATGTAAAGPNSGAASTITAALAATGTVGKLGAAATVITAGLAAAGSANLTGAVVTTVTVAFTATGTAAGVIVPVTVTGTDRSTTTVTASDTGSGVTGTDRASASVSGSDRPGSTITGSDQASATITSS
jgi:hypothetical protein